MDDLMKRAQRQMQTPPKKPGSGVKAQIPMIDGQAKVHWVWCDDWTAACLFDMGRKLAAAEAELAQIKGSVQ